jgi:hypothetical protein
MTDIITAIETLVDKAKFSIEDGDYDKINWKDERPKPTKEQIQAKIAELEAAEPMRLLREQRDKLLTQTDWWAVADRTMTAEKTAYRTALRDLPANSPNVALDEHSNLINVTWPTKPE